MPAALRDFLRCRTDTAELSPGDLDWIPKPSGPMVPSNLPTPSATFSSGESGAVEVTISWGFLSLTLTATVQDGKLNIASPSPLVPTGDIDEWVNDLNADLEANGKQFDNLSVVNGKLQASKRPIAVPATEPASATPAPVTVAVATSGTTTPAEPPILGPGASPRVKRFFDKWDRKKAAIGGGGALALGVAAFFLFTGGNGGDPVAQPPPVTPPSVVASVPATPATVSTSSTSSTSTTSTTSTTTTTVAPTDGAGTRIGMATDPPDDAVACGTGDPVDSAFDIRSVDVFAGDDGTLTVRVSTTGSPMRVLDPVTGDWSAAIQVDMALPDGPGASLLAEVHNGQPAVGLLDPGTGQVTPNGIVIGEESVDFSHRFDSPPAAFDVTVLSFHSTDSSGPTACDDLMISLP